METWAVALKVHVRAVFFLIGPTAVGKSSIVADVALRTGAEILNADPFQMYRGLEILTAQPSAEIQVRVAHHLLGVVSPAESMSAAKFRAFALKRLEEISVDGKRIMAVSGSGLYVKALTHGFDRTVAPNPQLRRRLQQLPLATAVKQLQDLSPQLAAQTDLKNPRRVIRAIEIANNPNSAGSQLNPFPQTEEYASPDWSAAAPGEPPGGVLLLRDREDLYRRINDRVVNMFDWGVEEEIRALTALGETAAAAIGLGEIRQLLAGAISREECIVKIQQASRRYAKRQLTWFRHQTSFPQLNLTAISHEQAVSAVIQMAERHFAPE